MTHAPELWHVFVAAFLCAVTSLVPAVLVWRMHRRAFSEWYGWVVAWCGAICVGVAIWFIAWFCVFSVVPSFHEATQITSLPVNRSSAGSVLDAIRVWCWVLATLSFAPALIEMCFLTRAGLVAQDLKQCGAILVACAIWGTGFGLGASIYSIIVRHGGSDSEVVDANAKSLRDWMACGPWTESSVAQSKEIGNQVVAAIARYKTDHGAHPDQLRDLVPDYLEAIPAPVAGSARWTYRIHSWQWPNAPRDSNFTLSFGVDYVGGRSFYSAGNGWHDGY